MKYSDIDRFWNKVKITENCWVWQGWSDYKGYGFLSIQGKMTRAHRVAYKLVFGKLTPGLVIDHICRNRLCVNPDHLREVTNKENVLCGFGISAQNARKTQCKFGHPFSERKNGSRICITCNNITSKHLPRNKELLVA